MHSQLHILWSKEEWINVNSTGALKFKQEKSEHHKGMFSSQNNMTSEVNWNILLTLSTT